MNKELLNTPINFEDYLGIYVPIPQHYRIDNSGNETKTICFNQTTGEVTSQGVVCGERGCYAAFPELTYSRGQIRANGKPFFLKNNS